MPSDEIQRKITGREPIMLAIDAVRREVGKLFPGFRGEIVLDGDPDDARTIRLRVSSLDEPMSGFNGREVRALATLQDSDAPAWVQVAFTCGCEVRYRRRSEGWLPAAGGYLPAAIEGAWDPVLWLRRACHREEVPPSTPTE
jgi:hypothetical protein